jgi:hypothetical protein
MNPLVEKAHQAIANPEVQEILKKLSEHGLGVFMPHIHDLETGDFIPLPPGIVSVENNLKVSFHHASEVEVANSVPVAWIWDNSTQTAMACGGCYEVSGRHGNSGH